MIKRVQGIKFQLRLLVVFCTFITISGVASANYHDWAPTPPMGWNSWDCFGCSVTEDEVKANADYMAEHLKQYGWQYIVVDIQWYEPKSDKNSHDPYQYPSKLDTNIDEYGRVWPVIIKHPSSADGKGFKPLSDYVHGLGLKFGIHMMRGIPKAAYEGNTPILGTLYTARDIADTASTCEWNPDMFGVNPTKPGAQEYYNSIMNLVASWGVDYVKIDDLSRPYHQGEIELIRKAIDQCGRPIVLSTSPGATPLSAAAHVSQHANLWRISDDFWDSWPALYSQFKRLDDWSKWCDDGHYPDADMLPLGNVRARGEKGWTLFTQTEQKTLMIMWAIARSPLMMGGHMPNNDEYTLSLLTNPELLYVNQHSTANRQLSRDNDLIAWVAEDRNSDDLFVAFVNALGYEDYDINKAAWSSPVISRDSNDKALSFGVSLIGSDHIYLIADDAGDGHSCDHADWLNMKLVDSDGNQTKLTDLQWTNATAGWGQVAINKSISGNDLSVGNIKYPNGIGTHSNSIIEYAIPAGKYAELQGTAALDDGGKNQQHAGATIQFHVYTANPKSDAKASTISVSLPDIGVRGKCGIRDLWSRTDLGQFQGTFDAKIEPHGAGLYRISPQK